MKRLLLVLSVVTITSAAVAYAAAATGPNLYAQTAIVSDGSTKATTTDANLLNPWGIAYFPGGPWWISDNNSGFSTEYDSAGAPVVPTVTIPPPASGTGTATPTGIVANWTNEFFAMPGSTTTPPQLAQFIFSTEDGTIAAWNPAVNATQAQLVVDNSQAGAVYKGLAMGNNASGVFLYATNFHSGTIDVFDSNFHPAILTGNFSDSALPAGYAPFGIANINGNLFVTYALQDSAKHDPVHAKGDGYVDVFGTNGHLIKRFASKKKLNAPWGVTVAPYNFGHFSADILIGNFGDGKINGFDPVTGASKGQLIDAATNKPMVIDGLWGLSFGGALGSDPGALYFTAGPNSEADGVFGVITAQQPSGGGPGPY
jgi:uncharacterized protein (TIGR03118 family)